jgi:hypothetical protein
LVLKQIFTIYMEIQNAVKYTLTAVVIFSGGLQN